MSAIRNWTTRLTLLATLLAGAPAVPATSGSSDLKNWWQGPIHYIAEKRETKSFRALETDEDRALFVERFWARRDPSPGTITNEYRQLFWERVRDANDLFLDSHTLGWRTDRGKIYVLYGPPNTIEDMIHLKSGGNMRTSPGIIRWLYEGRPGGRTDVDPIVVVAFERHGNEYKLSIDPKLTSVFFDQLAVREETPSMRMAESLFSRPKVSELAVMLDMGKMQEVPPQAQVILERVETTESYRTRPVEIRVERYQPEETQDTVVVLTVDLTDDPPDSEPVVIGRFAPRDATRETRLLGETSFRFETYEGQRVAQGRLLLNPGTYDLTVMILDPLTSLPGVARRTLEVPQASERLRLSDVSLARKLEPVRYVALASHDEAFQVGPFRVIPRFGETLEPGEKIKLFYEIYGGTPPYQISYALEGKQGEDEWIALGRPAVSQSSSQAQAWGLPTSATWPLGSYRIVLEVQDSEARLTTVRVPFFLETNSGEGSESPADSQ